MGVPQSNSLNASYELFMEQLAAMHTAFEFYYSKDLKKMPNFSKELALAQNAKGLYLQRALTGCRCQCGMGKKVGEREAVRERREGEK